MVDDVREVPAVPQKGRRKIRKKRVALALLPLLILIGTGAFGLWYHNNSNSKKNIPVISPGISHLVAFPLYYPNSTTPGFTLSTAPNLSKGIVSFSFKYSGQIVSVNEQQMPPSIRIPANPEQLKLKIGKGWITNINGQPTGLIQTAKTLVVITSSGNLSSSTITQFMQSFTSVK